MGVGGGGGGGVNTRVQYHAHIILYRYQDHAGWQVKLQVGNTRGPYMYSHIGIPGWHQGQDACASRPVSHPPALSVSPHALYIHTKASIKNTGARTNCTLES